MTKRKQLKNKKNYIFFSTIKDFENHKNKHLIRTQDDFNKHLEKYRIISFVDCSDFSFENSDKTFRWFSILFENGNYIEIYESNIETNSSILDSLDVYLHHKLIDKKNHSRLTKIQYKEETKLIIKKIETEIKDLKTELKYHRKDLNET